MVRLYRSDPQDGVATRTCMPRFLLKSSSRSTASSASPDQAALLHNESSHMRSWEPATESLERMQYVRLQDAGKVDNLLVPPTPVDRNPRRMAIEAQKNKKKGHNKDTGRRRGLYDGEMEPEGVRGQEAAVTPHAQTPQTAPLTGSGGRFSIVTPDSLPTVEEERAPLQLSPITGETERLRPSTPTASSHSRKGSSHSRRNGSSHSRSSRAGPRHMMTESTASDDDIQRMMPDLMPSNSTPSMAAQRAAEAASNLADREDVEALNTAALNHVHNGEYNAALEAFRDVLDRNQSRFGPKHPSIASAYHNIGTVYAKQAAEMTEDSMPQRKCRSEALAAFQSAARSARDSLGSNHPNVAVSLVRIGFLLLQSRQYRNAAVTFQEALRIRIAHFGPTHGLVANLYNNLGVCFMHVQDFAKGQAQLTQALQIQRALVDRDEARRVDRDELWVHKLELADTLFNVGGLCLEWIRKQGPDARRTREAQRAFTECVQIRTEVLGSRDPAVVQAHSLLGMADNFEKQSRAMAAQKSQIPPRPTTPRATTPRRRPTNEMPPRPSATSVQDLMSIAKSYDVSKEQEFSKQPAENTRDIFRDPPIGAHHTTSRSAPMPVISVSKDEDDENDDANTNSRIAISPIRVPETAPNNSLTAVNGSGRDETMSMDISNEKREYDGEESCILSNAGVDSDHGRVHYPLTWEKAGISQSNPSNPDIMVARPFHSDPKAVAASLRPNGSGYEEPVSTGNKERDDVLNRARAILQQHSQEEDFESMSLETGVYSGIEKQELDKQKELDEDLLEDGVAPLGGDWPSTTKKTGRNQTLRVLLSDPMNNLPEIHAEGTKLLKSNYAFDALNLFEIVLECQKRRNGPLHPDVASALHNVGIAQLRANNHNEALKAFEEAARVRKGSLGRNHPHVAISLVKVGITLLLLRQFDDALWCFREALSVRKQALGPLHPSTARIYNNIGCVHVEFNEFQEARRAFESALDVQRNAFQGDPQNGPLMFGTATTLCNLGYLYRYRDMHIKASLVLREAVQLQESVLGRSHATVLSTLDNLADSFANSGNTADALRTYNIILERFRFGGRTDSVKMSRAKAVLLYKMSRVHRQRKDRANQLDTLQKALQSMNKFSNSNLGDGEPDSLERRIQYDIAACREQLERDARNKT